LQHVTSNAGKGVHDVGIAPLPFHKRDNGAEFLSILGNFMVDQD